MSLLFNFSINPAKKKNRGLIIYRFLFKFLKLFVQRIIAQNCKHAKNGLFLFSNLFQVSVHRLLVQQVIQCYLFLNSKTIQKSQGIDDISPYIAYQFLLDKKKTQVVQPTLSIQVLELCSHCIHYLLHSHCYHPLRPPSHHLYHHLITSLLALSSQ